HLVLAITHCHPDTPQSPVTEAHLRLLPRKPQSVPGIHRPGQEAVPVHTAWWLAHQHHPESSECHALPGRRDEFRSPSRLVPPPDTSARAEYDSVHADPDPADVPQQRPK